MRTALAGGDRPMHVVIDGIPYRPAAAPPPRVLGVELDDLAAGLEPDRPSAGAGRGSRP